MTIILLSTTANAGTSRANTTTFLNDNFPEYANDAKMISVISAGEEEWV